MENLKFGGAFIPRYSEMEFYSRLGVLSSHDEQIWCVDNDDSFSHIYCFYFSKDFIDAKIPNRHMPCEIYPMLSLLNLEQSDFCIGETFDIKGLPFYITDDCSAIATKSIGSFAWEDDEYGVISNPNEGVYIYDISSLQDIVQDWYNYFIQDATVAKKRLEHREDILKYYDIMPMPGVSGRYHIVNKAGKVRHNARGYGFTSQEKAINMLLGYASKEPIPQEDIDAYEKYDERDDAFKATLPFFA